MTVTLMFVQNSGRNKAGLNSFVLTPRQWIDATHAIGLVSKSGRYGGTYAHKDIAFEFAAWISVEFKLYLIKEFQRLKEDENRRLSLAWNLNRTLSKLNYRIHTDAIKAHLIPVAVTLAQVAITYANEADMLNVALFGQTAKQWRDGNPSLEGNMRDYATVEQLLVLANIEGMNAELIHMGLSQGERLKRLNEIAIRQMQVLTSTSAIKQLKGYANKGWKNWGDWLGTKNRRGDWREFREARAFVRKLKLKSQAEWLAFAQGRMTRLGRLPADIPICPNETYVDRGWKGIGDWLGTGRTRRTKR